MSEAWPYDPPATPPQKGAPQHRPVGPGVVVEEGLVRPHQPIRCSIPSRRGPSQPRVLSKMDLTPSEWSDRSSDRGGAGTNPYGSSPRKHRHGDANIRIDQRQDDLMRVFEGPSVLYRMLALRQRSSPIYLKRTLSYVRQGRSKPNASSDANISSGGQTNSRSCSSLAVQSQQPSAQVDRPKSPQQQHTRDQQLGAATCDDTSRSGKLSAPLPPKASDHVQHDTSHGSQRTGLNADLMTTPSKRPASDWQDGRSLLSRSASATTDPSQTATVRASKVKRRKTANATKHIAAGDAEASCDAVMSADSSNELRAEQLACIAVTLKKASHVLGEHGGEMSCSRRGTNGCSKQPPLHVFVDVFATAAVSPSQEPVASMTLLQSQDDVDADTNICTAGVQDVPCAWQSSIITLRLGTSLNASDAVDVPLSIDQSYPVSLSVSIPKVAILSLEVDLTFSARNNGHVGAPTPAKSSSEGGEDPCQQNYIQEIKASRKAAVLVSKALHSSAAASAPGVTVKWIELQNRRCVWRLPMTELRCPWCRDKWPSVLALLRHLDCNHQRFLTSLEGCDTASTSYQPTDRSIVISPAEIRVDPNDIDPYSEATSTEPEPFSFWRGSVTEPEARPDDFNRAFHRRRLNQMRLQGLHRKYYHSGSCDAVRPPEVADDSEQEIDMPWFCRLDSERIQSFMDLAFPEKVVMELWNHYVFEHNIISDAQVSKGSISFVSKYAPLLASTCSATLKAHLISLADYGILQREDLSKCCDIINKYSTTSP